MKSNTRNRIIVFAVLTSIYVALFVAVCRTPFYDVTGEHNDRLFSTDDVYYVTEFFSEKIDDSPRIIKHPLLIAFGCAFTKAEKLLLGDISIKHHYELIVVTQIVCSLLSSAFLDLILEKQYGIKTLRALLLCSVFSLSFSTIFFTFVAESYIGSSLILIMTFYFAREKKAVPTVLLGICAAGITITNSILWALIVIAACGMNKKTVIILLAAGASFCAAVAALPLRNAFYSGIISGGINSARNYADRFPLIEQLRRIFYAFFGSTAFYLSTESISPFGEFSGDALSFIPKASVAVTAVSAVWLGLLVYSAIKCRKNKLLYAPVLVLAANLVLHGVIGYGIKEGFLYSLHHFPAQVLIASLPLASAERKDRWVVYTISGYLVCLVALNIQGYVEIARFIAG